MKDIELARDLFETTPKPCGLGDCVDCKYFNKDNICIELKQAESLIARGYQKIKWHKVSEGDFPDNGREVLAYYIDNEEPSGYGCGIAWYNLSTKEFNSNTIYYPYIIKIAAWIDKPQYFEYEGIKL